MRTSGLGEASLKGLPTTPTSSSGFVANVVDALQRPTTMGIRIVDRRFHVSNRDMNKTHCQIGL